MGIIKFAVKSSLAGGIVYYTTQEGLWSSADDSIKFYEKMYNNVTPYVKEYISSDVTTGIATIPNASTMIGCSRGVWNKGVKTSISFLAELPTHVSNGIDALMAMPIIKDSVENTEKNNEKTSKLP